MSHGADDGISRLQRSIGNDAHTRMIKRFCEYYPEKMVRLREAIEAGDKGEIARAAHALRGVPALFGAESAEQLVAQLERVAGETGLGGVQMTYRELRCKLEELCNCLLEQTPG